MALAEATHRKQRRSASANPDDTGLKRENEGGNGKAGCAGWMVIMG
jgi:hypothetical protein